MSKYLTIIISLIAMLYTVPAYSQNRGDLNGNISPSVALDYFMKGLQNYNGLGDYEQNYDEALRSFKTAASGDHKQAQHYLGLMYFKGLGVEKDLIEAYMWFDLASDGGDKLGMVLKLTLRDLLTEEELAEAISRREAWQHSSMN